MDKNPDSEALAWPLWPTTGKALGLSRNSVYEAAARHEIPTVRIGRRILVPVSALKDMLAKAGTANG